MKIHKAGNHMFLILISIINLFWLTNPLISQEEPLRAFKWYYCPRAYPFDTIPGGAFNNAVEQRNALLQSTGYQLTGNYWAEIGPKPFYYGTIMSSGRIYQVVYHPRDTNVVYVTGASGGLWKSTNEGDTWENKSGDLPSLSSGAFVIDAENNILYFGCGGGSPPYFGDGRSMGIFKSTNGGSNWTPISSGIKYGTAINKIVISPNDQTENTLFAATSKGLYKTINAGSLWIKIIPRPEDPIQELICNDICFSPDGTIVYAVGPSVGHLAPYNIISDGIGYWRSDDGGSIFSPISQASGYPRASNFVCDRTLCAVSKASNNLVWFISFGSQGGTEDFNVYVYQSHNGGKNFTNRAIDNNSTTRFQLLLRASDVDSNICFAGANNLYRTTNGGTTDWSYLDANHVDYLSLDFNPFYPEKVTVGNDGGVFRSGNLGNSWSQCNQNLGGITLLHGSVTSTYDANFAVCGLQDYGFGYNFNAGSSTYWFSTSAGGDGGNLTASPFKSKHFVGNKTYDRKIYYSTNGSNFVYAGGYLSAAEHSPFVHHPSEPGVVYTARYEGENPQLVHFRKSIDYGATWGADNSPLRYFNRPSTWEHTVPYLIAISQSNPNTIIMNFGNENEFFLSEFNAKSRLIKSTNGGLNWLNEPQGNITKIVEGGDGHGLPNRSFTDVEFDPKDENIVYLTVSGYYYPSSNQGHVFRSVNGGYNWDPINGSLPDMPVTDLMIHYTGTGENDKELIIATDAGIYSTPVTNPPNWNWSEIADGFPKTTAFFLDYNRLSGKLRTNTWGRGAWELQLDYDPNNPTQQSPIYVQDRLYLTDDVTINAPIIVGSGGKLILGHSLVPEQFNITFNNNAKIIVMDGGEIIDSGHVAITLTSSGSWGGIELQNGGYGTIKNCTFENTETPITIDGESIGGSSNILIYKCTFNEGSITASGRNNITIEKCTTNTASSSTGVGINAVYCNNLVLYQNEINNCWAAGISVSNSSPAILNNVISNTEEFTSTIGISMDNSYSATINQNTVNEFATGIYLYNSSPVMYNNSIINVENGLNALDAEFQSYPRLHPTFTENGTYWDGGENTLHSTNSGNGIYVYNSEPDIDYGYNDINGYQYYITGYEDLIGIEPTIYYMRCNTWGRNPPDPNKFSISNRIPVYESTDCGQGGGNHPPLDLKSPVFLNNPNEPPPPIIINYGNGIYDTIRATTLTKQVPADQMLYSQAVKNELTGNYNTAFSQYQQIIQNYHDSLTATNSLWRLVQCRDKIPYNPANYNELRSYYINLSQQNQNDTLFKQITDELAAKCLVRLINYPDAITEYEGIINRTNDSGEVLCSELNIIETYMIMQNNGMLKSFTGQISSLKPKDLKDGYRMILEKLHKISNKPKEQNIPIAFKLSQNYPNPFNPITKINYALPNKSNVTIKVFDILGRLVKTLVNEFKDAGYYTVTFDGSNLSSGIYFYTIEAGNFRDSKKMVLVK